MAKELFTAGVDEAASAMRTAQRAMSSIDEAKGEIYCTHAVNLLEKAHRDLCMVISFLNGGDNSGIGNKREFDPDFSERRKALGRNGDFLKAGGAVKFSDPGTYRRRQYHGD